MVTAEREKGQFLTDSLRSRLAACGHEPNEGHNPQYRRKVRERTKGALDHLGPVGRHLSPKDVEMIFTQHHPEGKPDTPVHTIPDADTRQRVIEEAGSEAGRGELKDGVVAAESVEATAEDPGRLPGFRNDIRDVLTLLFQGIMEMPDVEMAVPYKAENEHGEKSVYLRQPESFSDKSAVDFDLESLISEAIERAAEQRGKRVEECTIDVELCDAEDIESVRERFEEGEFMDYDELLRLHHETDVTGEEIQQYHDRLREATPDHEFGMHPAASEMEESGDE